MIAIPFKIDCDKSRAKTRFDLIDQYLSLEMETESIIRNENNSLSKVALQHSSKILYQCLNTYFFGSQNTSRLCELFFTEIMVENGCGV